MFNFKDGFRLPRYWAEDGYPIVGGVIMRGAGRNSSWVPSNNIAEERGWEDDCGWYTGGRITDPRNFKTVFSLSDKQVMGYVVTCFLDCKNDFPKVDDWMCMTCGYAFCDRKQDRG